MWTCTYLKLEACETYELALIRQPHVPANLKLYHLFCSSLRGQHIYNKQTMIIDASSSEIASTSKPAGTCGKQLHSFFAPILVTAFFAPRWICHRSDPWLDSEYVNKTKTERLGRIENDTYCSIHSMEIGTLLPL